MAGSNLSRSVRYRAGSGLERMITETTIQTEDEDLMTGEAQNITTKHIICPFAF